MPITQLTDLTQINSTSYSDLVGLQVGLDRLPAEDTITYLKRLQQAANYSADHSYIGVLAEINLQLGLGISQCISLASTASNIVVTCSISGLVLSCTGETVTIPLCSFDPDGMWRWKTLSEVVAAVNKSINFTATLLATDNLAVQLARQSNVFYSIAEPVSDLRSKLQHTGIQVGTELFNQKITGYTLDTNGVLTFLNTPPANLEITYKYTVWPYSLVGTEGAIISLTDPSTATAGISNSIIAYQIREAIQTIMQDDRSYWTK